jgi:hypothetical protein
MLFLFMLLAFLYRLEGGDSCPFIGPFKGVFFWVCTWRVFFLELLWYLREIFGLNYELTEEVGYGDRNS